MDWLIDIKVGINIKGKKMPAPKQERIRKDAQIMSMDSKSDEHVEYNVFD